MTTNKAALFLRAVVLINFEFTKRLWVHLCSLDKAINNSDEASESLS